MRIVRFIIVWLILIVANINRLTPQTITTIAGDGCVGANSGNAVPATSACIGYPVAGSFDALGNYYFGQDLYGSTIRKISTTGIITTVAGNGNSGYGGDNGPATAASFDWPYAIADSAGNIYLANFYNYRVRKVDASTGIIHTIAGIGHGGHSGDGGPATLAALWPSSICVDRHGNVYVTDSSTWIRRISPSGIITTVAGNGNQGYSGDGGAATDAALYTTYGLCTDNQNNLYIGDFNGRIRKIDENTGIITTIAGNGISSPYIGDGLPASSSQFLPYTITVDKYYNIFICDYGIGNSRVLMIDNSGIVRTIAGTGVNGYSGDGGSGSATAAQIANPEGVAIDSCGNIYIADDAYRRIRKITFPHCGYEMVNKTTEELISVYPNPFNESVEVDNIKGSMRFSVLNLLGKMMVCGTLESNENKISLKDLKQGMYFMELINDENKKTTVKIIKQ